MDHPAIDYSNALLQHPVDDPVARLQRRIDGGEVKLAFDPNHGGYLPALLKALQMNADSQVLVFSKTSFQSPKISPKAPRALYFNDTVQMGFVHGSDVMEFAALDPQQGVIFYTLDNKNESKPAYFDRPSFFRRTDECLACHLIPGTLNIPGLMISSVIPTPQGSPRFPGAGLIVDSRTPIQDRWGGWYVTGTTGTTLHRGNAVAPYPDRPEMLELRGTQNLTSLATRFDTSTYLAPTSDIVALMTLEHQVRAANLITRINWEVRMVLLENDQNQSLLAEFQPRLDFLTTELANYMLFAGEAKIYEPIAGVSTFTRTFPQQGPRDSQGRSLRDFDLTKRLFRYPLSFMIYSEAFDALPDLAKQQIYRKLFTALTLESTTENQATLAILRETKPNLPGYWSAQAR